MTQRKERLSTRQKKVAMLETLKKSYGITVASACEEVGISRKTYYEWLKKDAKFKEAVENMEESVLDLAEASLVKSIQEQNITATIFYLKTKGKNRGYIEQGNIVQVNTTFDELRDKTDEELIEILNRKV